MLSDAPGKQGCLKFQNNSSNSVKKSCPDYFSIEGTWWNLKIAWGREIQSMTLKQVHPLE